MAQRNHPATVRGCLFRIPECHSVARFREWARSCHDLARNGCGKLGDAADPERGNDTQGDHLFIADSLPDTLAFDNGEELSPAWEVSEAAFTFQNDHITDDLVEPGPNHSSNEFAATTEVYVWNKSAANRALAQTWITAWRALTDAQKNDTRVILDDGANQAPTAVGTIANQTVTVPATVDVDVESNFTDPDDDALTYTAVVTLNATRATVSVTGSVVTVTGVSVGLTQVTVTATDPSGESVDQSFFVTVTAATLSVTLPTGTGALGSAARPAVTVALAAILAVTVPTGTGALGTSTAPAVTIPVLLQLSDAVTDGRDSDVLALLERTETGVVLYADSNRGGTDTPIEGELGLGADGTLITRLQQLTTAQLTLNDNNVPAALDLSVYFDAGGGGRDLTLSLYTLEDGEEQVTIDSAFSNAGGNFARLDIPVGMQTLLGNLDVGERWIVQFWRATTAPSTILTVEINTGTGALGSSAAPAVTVVSAPTTTLTVTVPTGTGALGTSAAPAVAVVSATEFSPTIQIIDVGTVDSFGSGFILWFGPFDEYLDPAFTLNGSTTVLISYIAFSNIGVVQVNLTGGSDELVGSLEPKDNVFTFQVPGLDDLIVHGPSNPDNINSDSVEPYTFTPVNVAEVIAFFNQLTATSDLTVVIRDDGGAVEPVTLTITIPTGTGALGTSAAPAVTLVPAPTLTVTIPTGTGALGSSTAPAVAAVLAPTLIVEINTGLGALGSSAAPAVTVVLAPTLTVTLPTGTGALGASAAPAVAAVPAPTLTVEVDTGTGALGTSAAPAVAAVPAPTLTIEIGTGTGALGSSTAPAVTLVPAPVVTLTVEIDTGTGSLGTSAAPAVTLVPAPTLTVTIPTGTGALGSSAAPAVTIPVQLQLADAVTEGRESDVLALLERTNAGNSIYADSNRGGTDTPIAGELGLGDDETLITRINTVSASLIAFNDNNVPTALDLGVYFGVDGAGRDLTLSLYTLDDGEEQVVVDSGFSSAGGNFLRIDIPAGMQTLLGNLDVDDRWIVQFWRVEVILLTVEIGTGATALGTSAAPAVTVIPAPVLAVTVPTSAGALGSSTAPAVALIPEPTVVLTVEIPTGTAALGTSAAPAVTVVLAPTLIIEIGTGAAALGSSAAPVVNLVSAPTLIVEIGTGAAALGSSAVPIVTLVAAPILVVEVDTGTGALGSSTAPAVTLVAAPTLTVEVGTGTGALGSAARPAVTLVAAIIVTVEVNTGTGALGSSDAPEVILTTGQFDVDVWMWDGTEWLRVIDSEPELS